MWAFCVLQRRETHSLTQVYCGRKQGLFVQLTHCEADSFRQRSLCWGNTGVSRSFVWTHINRIAVKHTQLCCVGFCWSNNRDQTNCGCACMDKCERLEWTQQVLIMIVCAHGSWGDLSRVIDVPQRRDTSDDTPGQCMGGQKWCCRLYFVTSYGDHKVVSIGSALVLFFFFFKLFLHFLC